MEQRRPPEYILEVFADQTCVRDIVKGMRVQPKHQARLPAIIIQTDTD